jgi:hypothetical protein
MIIQIPEKNETKSALLTSWSRPPTSNLVFRKLGLMRS